MSFQIREATSADAGGIRALVERVFGMPMPEAEWRWKFEANPDGWRCRSVSCFAARGTAS